MLELTEKAFNTQLSEHFKMVARVHPPIWSWLGHSCQLKKRPVVKGTSGARQEHQPERGPRECLFWAIMEFHQVPGSRSQNASPAPSKTTLDFGGVWAKSGTCSALAP